MCKSAGCSQYPQVSADARDVSALPHLDRLPALIRLLAANNAGEVVKAHLGADAGIPET